MAIYSLSHSTIGRTTHDAGTAGAHLGYITRASACRIVISEHIPTATPGTKGGAARTWMDEQESKDRKNARVVDKLMLALPKELNETARVQVVRTFIHELANGKAVPFFAAIHDKADTKDAANPHAHIVIRDRCPETGKGRVIGMSEKGSTERAREVWERVCNAALMAEGSEARIDRRSLNAQGIDRAPQVHEGPTARQIQSKGKHSKKLEQISWEKSVDKAERDRRKKAAEIQRRRTDREKEIARIEDETFYAAREAFTPIGNGIDRDMLPSIALWMTIEPVEATLARNVLGLKKDTTFSECREALSRVSPTEKSSILVEVSKSDEAQRYRKFCMDFSLSQPARDRWADFVHKLDEWGRRLLSKLVEIVPRPSVPLENMREKGTGSSQPQEPQKPQASRTNFNSPSL